MQAVGAIIGRFNTYIINPAILLIIALGFFLFTWGLVQFLLGLGDDGHGNAYTEGKKHMFWGVIGMVVMFSVWGIIGLINDTFSLGLNTNNGTYTPDTSGINNIGSGATFFGQ